MKYLHKIPTKVPTKTPGNIFTLAFVSWLAAISSMVHAQSDEVTMATLLDRVQIEDMMINFYSDLTQYNAERNELDNVFIPEAVMEVNGFVMTGRDAIRDAYSSRQNESVVPGSTMNMIISNPRIKVSANTATMHALWTGILNESLEHEPRLLEQGTDYAEFIKVDGHWRIKYRVIKSLSNMPAAWDGD
jgi:hypothetical protein